MRLTQMHVLFWAAHHAPGWIDRVQGPRLPVLDASIDVCVNEHASLRPRHYELDAHNLLTILRSVRARGDSLVPILLRLATEPGTVVRPDRRKAYARKWLLRVSVLMVYRPLLPETRNTPQVTVYLLHFDKRVGNGSGAQGSAGHYIGFTTNPDQRLEDHLKRNGSKLVRAAISQGIAIELAAEWKDVSLRFEYQLKNRGGASCICPICKANRGR